MGAAARTSWLLLGVTAPGADVSLAAAGRERPVLERLPGPGGGAPVQAVRIPSSAGSRRFAVAIFTEWRGAGRRPGRGAVRAAAAALAAAGHDLHSSVSIH